MRRSSLTPWAYCALILLAAVGTACASEESDQMAEMLGGQQFGRGKEKKAAAVKSDIPYIRCGTCEAIVKQSLRMLAKLQSEETKAKKLSESDLLEQLETMCDPDGDAGEWINHIDLVETGSALKLVEMKGPGECGRECRTVARACADMMDEADIVEISQSLWSGAKRAALTQMLCYDQTNACKKKTPPLPKDRPLGPKFDAVPEDKLSVRETMRKMKGSGMGGTLFNRDDMMSKMGLGEDDMGGDGGGMAQEDNNRWKDEM